jgi:phosphoenolpyruvate synthase/pyruvate phosphate dikinase
MTKFNPYIQGKFSQGTRATAEIIGGKARQLLNIPLYVPYWIVVTSDCPDDKLSEAVEFAILTILKDHHPATWDNKLAVRSSATSEDGDSQSYAGIFESKLNVPITEAYSAVQEIRQSARTSKVKAYSGNDAHNIAVIIMPMVDAKWSGVLFSKEPVEGTDRMLLEWQDGVGGVVDGTGDSSHVFLGTGDNITEHMDSCFDGKTIALPELGALPMEQVVQLWNQAKRLENNYNRPVDIEWCISFKPNHASATNTVILSKGIYTLSVLQVRPITTLGASNDNA